VSKKILIIDDYEPNLKLLEKFLNLHGYETCTAKDSVEGFEAIHKESPGLIILDMKLDDAWGSRFFRMLTEVDEFKEIPLIIKSGIAETYVPVEKALAFFISPFNPFDLLEVIKKAIG